MSYLDTIIKQSPWLLDASAIKTDVHLTQLQSFALIYHEVQFLEYRFEDGVYLVTGPRQIGKSTHMKMFITKHLTDKNKGNFLYFNCDLLDSKRDIVSLVETYLTEFPSKQRRYIILDEITSVKDSFLAIKFLVDSGHRDNLTYILTGSNTISIKKTGEYLPGRRGKGIDFHFLPISFKNFVQLLHPKLDINITLHSTEKEFIAFKQKAKFTELLETYLITGGFPRVINEYHRKQIISDDIFTIYRSWITSEIAKADRKEYITKRILERCLFSLGSDISYNAFAQDTGIGSHNTVYDYLDFLINAFVISQIYQYDIHQKQINYRKNKKIYFNDPFIYAVIEAWLSGKPRQNYDYLKQTILKAALIENLVFLKLASDHPEVYFYKDSSEIDFVTANTLIEVKYQNKIISADYSPLLKYPQTKLLITKSTLRKEKDITFLPVEYFLLC